MNSHQEFGVVFKHKREELGHSLKDVESALSIRNQFLEAIERGELSQLISPAYAKGFVKQYALFLGLDGDAILREHRHLLQFGHQEGARPLFYHQLERRGGGASSFSWVYLSMWVAGGLLLFFFIQSLFKR